MKKIFAFLIVSSVLLTTQSANCQRLSVATDISTFNVNQHESSLETASQRSWWQAVLNAVTVVAADIGGAYAGVAGTVHVAGAVGLATGGTGVAIVAGVAGVVGAAGASNGAYHGLHRSMPAEPGYGNLIITLPRLPYDYSLIGKQHNSVIHRNFFLGEPVTNFYGTLLDDSQKAVIESEQMTEIFSFLQSLGTRYSENNFSFGQMTTELKNKGLMTLVGEEILTAFFEKYRICASPKDMENLINFSINKVNEAALEVGEKQALLAAFMVASESPFYQNPQLNN